MVNNEDPMWWVDEIGAIDCDSDAMWRYIIYHLPWDWRRMMEAKLSMIYWLCRREHLFIVNAQPSKPEVAEQQPLAMAHLLRTAPTARSTLSRAIKAFKWPTKQSPRATAQAIQLWDSLLVLAQAQLAPM